MAWYEIIAKPKNKAKNDLFFTGNRKFNVNEDTQEKAKKEFKRRYGETYTIVKITKSK